MHEQALARAIVRQILEALPAPDARVTQVHLRLGALAGERPEALRLAFDLAAAGTSLEGAVLRIDEDDAVLAEPVEIVAFSVVAPDGPVGSGPGGP
ncbi:MAG: hydrogenase maturation nickel metallochaperone HypA [Candidatus Nanopelagicales bacterium]|jgi:Zn finger protein HypA/HybF involved in hydrogenase expression|nr:hydrogenase maturation nickel metallochaperone HypA [Candidatus Nanopelagicales bacterium]